MSESEPRARPQGPPRRRRYLYWLAATLLILLGLPLAFALWLVASEPGLQLAARMAVRASGDQLVLNGASGRLIGPLRIDELRVENPDLRLRMTGVALTWRPASLLDHHLDVDELAVDVIEFSSRPGEDPAAIEPPDSLALPLSVSMRALRLGKVSRLEFGAAPGVEAVADLVLTGLAAEFYSDGRRHRIVAFEGTLPFGQARFAGDVDGGASPFPLNAQGRLAGEREGHAYVLDFAAEGDLLAPRIALQAEGAGLAGDAEVLAAPFAPVPLNRVRIALGDVDPSAFQADAPRAALRIDADLASESTEQWILAGPVSIENRRPGRVDESGLPFERLAAHLRWTPEVVQVDGLAADLLGKGRIEGDATWRPGTGGDPLGQLTAALSLAGVALHRLDARLPEAVLSGPVKASGDSVRQTAELDIGVGEARVRVRGGLAQAAEPDGPRSFTLSGDLAAFDPHVFAAQAPPASLNLAFEAAGRLTEVPQVDLSFTLRPSRLEGRPVSGQGKVAVEGERLVSGDVGIEWAGNRAKLNGAWGRAQDELAFEIDAPALAALGHGLGGRARVSGVVGGTLAQPVGRVSLFAESLSLPGGVRVAALNAQGRLEAGLDGPVVLSLGLTGLGADKAWVDSATVAMSGRRDDHAIDLFVAGTEGDRVRLRMEGGLRAATGSGAAGQLAADRWEGRLTALETEGRFPARLTGPAALTLAPDRVELAAAVLDAGERGRIRLAETRWTPERIAARGDLSGLAFGLLSGPEGRRRGGPGPLVLGAEWDLRLAETAEGELRVFRQSGDLTVTGEMPTRLGLEHLEARLTARDNRLALSWEGRGSELGELSGAVTALAERDAQAGWRLAPDGALLGSARLSMPSIAWAGRLLQDALETGGSMEAAFSVSGTPANPLATGRITGKALSIALVDQGLHLAGGELLAEFDRDRLRLTRLEFVSPNRVRPRDDRPPVDRLTREPGRLSASGEIELDSGAGRFRFRADRLPILQRPERWLILSGDGAATSTWTSLDLQAGFRADAGYVELADTPPPSLSDDVVIVGQEEAAASAEGGLKLAADITVSLGDHLYVSALGLDTRLAGELRLRMRDGEPLSAVGTIATAGGTFRGYGQNLSIERGLINFQGPLDNPGLNVVALRKGLAVEAGIAVTGSVRRPQVRLVSEPNVPDPDKLSWIVLGRPPVAGSGADLGLLLPAAQALLGGPGGGMTDQLSRSLGFDEVSIGQGELNEVSRTATSRVVGQGTVVTGEGTVSGQVLTLGKRLSSDLFLSFEQSLGGAENLVKLTYQLSRRVSVVARGGTNSSADIYYTISFN